MNTVPIVLLCALFAAPASIPDQVDDAAAVLQFQRAADAYAFAHRQDERRGATPASGAEGTLFTPQVAAAFRSRIRTATRNESCGRLAVASTAMVPRVNMQPGDAAAVPACIAAVLPRLPDELEYRIASVALLLVDAHRQVVVDVLHAAFP